MSFYHDHAFQPPANVSDHLYQPTADIAHHAHDDNHVQNAPDTDTTRYCSVRGCTAPLPADYTNKMCEACRGRHRIYASTKRAKRKMEKAALGLTNGVSWMPGDGDSSGNARTEASPPSEAGPSGSSSQHPPSYEYTDNNAWDDNALDPRLYHHSSSSELAGALIYPPPQSSPGYSQPPSMTATPPDSDPPTASTSAAPFGFDPATRTAIGPPITAPSPPKGEISSRSISEAAASQNSSLPPRYCSIKGCKTVIEGGSLFKMCDSCRAKYKGYGTTKRKKWKEEKTKAMAELERQREHENKIRAENGLPPLPLNTRVAWLEDEVDGQRIVDTSVPRMCTVSHCREILPIGYEYLRCERHRIQNRHHSKLKRYRDKESKAQALEGWYASVADSMPETALVHTPRDSHSRPENTLDDAEADEDEDEPPAIEYQGPEEHREAVTLDINMLEPQVIVFGVPPAARGVRRTNHSCCIKGCFNLLSPTTPWKMCDQCRAHERSVRRVRALRESGIDIELPPPRWVREKREPKPKTTSTRNKKGKQKETDTQTPDDRSRSVSRDRTTDGETTEREGSELIFMDPILPDEEPPVNEQGNRSLQSELSFVMADQEGNIREPPQASQSGVVSNSSATGNPTDAEGSGSPTKRKRASKRKENVAQLASEASTSSVAPATSEAGPSSALVPVPPPQTLFAPPPPTGSAPAMPPPPYGIPYYPPAPYATPYFQGAPYPYPPPLPPFPREGFAPSPMYQPPFATYGPYPPYPPYPYYPPPYGHPAYPPPPPPPGVMLGPPPPDSSQGSASAGPSHSPYVGMPPPPPPPPDPSTMYGMFSIRTPACGSRNKDKDKDTASSSSTSEPAPESAAAPPLMITAAPGKEPVYSQVLNGEPPMRKKRRKADYEALAAFLKRREEESIAKVQAQTAQGSGGGQGSASGGDVPLRTPVMPVSAPPEAPVQVDPPPAPTPAPAPAPAEVETDNAVPAEGISADAHEKANPRICSNKTCHRHLMSSDTGSICLRCKERVKKHALKVKKRYKLVPSASSIAATKKVASPLEGAPSDIPQHDGHSS